MEVIKFISKILATPFLALIFVYQRTISPDHGFLSALYPYGYCQFYPSCSEYARRVLVDQGVIGFPKIIKRLIKCRPGVSCSVDMP